METLLDRPERRAIVLALAWARLVIGGRDLGYPGGSDHVVDMGTLCWLMKCKAICCLKMCYIFNWRLFYGAGLNYWLISYTSTIYSLSLVLKVKE